ncbi:MAG: hypothetical protein V1882_03090 [Candidatus Omnitrophota bacterium]
MPDRKLEASAYRKLVTDIAVFYEGARKALVEAYWKIGQRIVEVEQKGAVRATRRDEYCQGHGLLRSALAY